jgi:hypothetical protein
MEARRVSLPDGGGKEGQDDRRPGMPISRRSGRRYGAALTQAIDRRGELIEELRGLDPQVRAAGEWLAGASQVVREHVVQMAQEVARLRERVLEQVRGQEQAVRATKAKLASEAGKLVAIGSALQAYRTTRTVAARFTDSRG